MKRTLTGLATCLFLLGIASMAQATLIDFTSTTWQGIGGETASESIDGINVTLNATGGNLTWNDEHGTISIPNGLAGIGDGIGITNDEVSLNQTLRVSFSPDVIVSEIYFLDLFSLEPESASYSFDTGLWVSVDGTTHQYGFVGISTGSSSSTSWVEFKTNDSSSISDYAIAGMEVAAPVPEPASMFLLGTGLVGLAGSRLRRKKKA